MTDPYRTVFEVSYFGGLAFSWAVVLFLGVNLVILALLGPTRSKWKRLGGVLPGSPFPEREGHFTWWEWQFA